MRHKLEFREVGYRMKRHVLSISEKIMQYGTQSVYAWVDTWDDHIVSDTYIQGDDERYYVE